MVCCNKKINYHVLSLFFWAPFILEYKTVDPTLNRWHDHDWHGAAVSIVLAVWNSLTKCSSRTTFTRRKSLTRRCRVKVEMKIRIKVLEINFHTAIRFDAALPCQKSLPCELAERNVQIDIFLWLSHLATSNEIWL